MTQSRIVIGLGYGDEGKGSWVDHLVRKYNTKYVVRFNGGAQALHHVVTSDGRTHGFSQFSSGTFVSGVKTVLSRFMLVEPLALVEESKELQKKGVMAPLSRLVISNNAPMIPYHNMALNRIMEVGRGAARHGSCGYGIGLTQADVEERGTEALYMGDIQTDGFEQKLRVLFEIAKEKAVSFKTSANADLVDSLLSFDITTYIKTVRRIRSQIRVVDEAVIQRIIRTHDTVFEGAQGVLLDQRYGTFPHCTRSTTTFANAETLLAEAGFVGEQTNIGLLRAYGTRHGAGPFVTEAALPISKCHNDTGEWQGMFRTGWFDAVAARYALGAVGRVDQLVLTNVDRLDTFERIKWCSRYSDIAETFYSAGSLTVPKDSLSEIALHTEALFTARPVYETCEGWNADGSYQEEYLGTLEKALGRKIDAISRSPMSDKEYR